MKIVFRNTATAATLTLSLVALTPLCGLFFACGCTWPWSGFFFDCNYFDLMTEHRCPWCASRLAGGLSAGLSVIFGVVASLARFATPIHCNRGNVFTRIGTGMLAFLCAASLSGWLAAHSQHYPLGPMGSAHANVKADQRFNADRFQSIRPAQ
ncbi:MAG: hypothetical protein ACR65R_11655 [Methylomicrobium sp.]